MNSKVPQNHNDSEPKAGKWWKNPLVILPPLVFVGTVDLVGALRKHDVHEAIAVSLIFFLLVPFAVLVRYFVRRISR
jgi:arginine exporter protein ArgO